jgi:hypothetical protein
MVELSRDAMFMDRPVEVRTVSVGVLMDSNDVQEASNALEKPDRFAGGLYVLAHALFWKDNGERVFAKADTIMADTPAPYIRQLIDLTNLATTLANQVAPDAIAKPANGHDAAAPSH